MNVLECGTRKTIKTMALMAFVSIVWLAPAMADDFSKGVDALDSGNHELAVRFFSSYLSRKPGTYEALVNRGTAFARSGHVFRAIADWHGAVELAPTFAYAFYSDDVVRQVTPRKKPVRYVASLELFPERAVSVIMTGALLLDLGLTGPAIDLFRMSTTLTRDPIFKTDLEYWIKTLDPGLTEKQE
ncbi:MAG: tetratricopeptide repeat protein [Desulfomonilaceae bacterium]